MQDSIILHPIMANAVHIDTVKLSHAYYTTELPSPDEFNKLNFDTSTKRRGGNVITIAYSKPTNSQSSDPRLMIIHSKDPFSYSGINVECSLAKLVDGNGLGIQTDEDINCALDGIEDFIRQRIGVDFDSRTAKVKRFDVNADFPVGEQRIGLYLDAISRPDSRLVQSTHDSTTKSYYNQSRALVIYGKMKEMENQFKKGKASHEDVLAAEGLLRVESRLIAGETIKRFTEKHSLDETASGLFTSAIASMFISDSLSKLKLDEPKISFKARDQLLIKHFGKDAAEMLGILEYRKSIGEDFWMKLGWSRATYYKKRKLLVDFNLWNISPTEALPPLAIPDAYNNPTSLS